MTVPVQVIFNSSTANGTTTVFPYSFKITDSADLEVSLNKVVQTSGYTVSGVGETAGGNVTFTTAPANGVTVLRALNPILKRVTDYQQFGDWTAATVNLDFDRMWLALQKVANDFKRSIKLPVDTASDQVIDKTAAQRANTLVGFDASGNLYTLALSALPITADAAASASAAATSEANAAASYDSFDDRYLGAKASDPTLDNDGNPLLTGALYWNTTTNTFKAWTGTAWAIFTVNAQPLDDQLTTLAGITAQQATDLASLSAFVGTLLNDGDAATFRASIGADLPAGTVIHVAQGSPPSGYLKANGAAVSRATYGTLFAAIGTVFGAGDGTTTFNVPDLRGEFIRGWDDGRGVDASRAIGSTQAGQVEAHVHTGGMNAASLGGGAAGSAVGTGPVNTGTMGGNETRPRNVALLACIKT